MANHLTNHGCPIPQLDKSNGRAIFAKPICNSYEQAVALLKTRNLGPGDIAVVRYYLSNTNTAWDDPTGLPVRMVMGIGGANAQADDDIYIFNDSRIDGGSYVTADDVEAMLIEFLNGYATKDDIKQIHAILKADEAWKELVNNSFEENTNDHENFSRDIDELRSKLDNINTPNVDLSNYYTKEEVDNLFNSIEIPEIDTSNLVSKDEFISELDKKADIDSLDELASAIELKANKEDVYTKTDVDDALANKVNADDVAEAIAEATEEINAEFQDALNAKANINDVYTQEQVDEKFVSTDELQSAVEDALANGDTVKNAVDEAILSADIPGKVKEEVNKLDVITTDELNSSLANKADASTVYTKDEIDASINEIKELINNIDIPETDLSNYYTKDEVYTKSEVDELIPDVTNFVTNEQLTTEVQNQIESSEVIKELQTKVETLDHLDGEELDIWYLTFASSEDDINTAIINNENVELESDIALASTLVFGENSDMAINIADSQLTKSGTGAVIRVNGGKLIIDGNDGHVDGNNNGIESGDNNAVRCSENGHIIINGGYFTVGDDGKNTGNALIYCTEGIVEIYGGTFEYTNSNNGRIYTLNCQDANYKAGKAKIIVYGGTFLNGYDPANSKSENPAGNFVAPGYKSIYNENDNSYTVLPE